MPIAMFVVPLGGSAAAGRDVCRRCGVWRECLAYAMADDSLEGTWAGTSASERRMLRKASA